MSNCFHTKKVTDRVTWGSHENVAFRCAHWDSTKDAALKRYLINGKYGVTKAAQETRN